MHEMFCGQEICGRIQVEIFSACPTIIPKDITALQHVSFPLSKQQNLDLDKSILVSWNILSDGHMW